MAENSSIASRIRNITFSLARTVKGRTVETEKTIKFGAVKFGADLSKLVPAPKSLLERLGFKRPAFVPEGTRPTIRSIFFTPKAIRKATLEREEGRPLSTTELTKVRQQRKFTANYLKQKLRFDPNLADKSLWGQRPWWKPEETFQENWLADQRRFLALAEARTGIRFRIDAESGEWSETVVGPPGKLMTDQDWVFYTHHLYANEALYGPIKDKLLELPPGEVSPPATQVGRRLGRANATGRSVGSYRIRRRA